MPFTINKLKVTSLKKCELEIIYAFGLVLFQKKTNMKLLFIQKNMGMYPENNCKDRDQLIICRVLAFFQMVEFLFKFFLNISCGCFGFNCVQTYLILASNYLHHMNSYPASLSSKGQCKQSFRVLTNHPAGVKMYKNRWNNSKTGAATSMYTQWAKKWTSGCNEYTYLKS